MVLATRRMARVGCLEAVGEEVAAAALWAFCSLASTPSRWRTLRRRREAWRSCSGVKKMVGVRCHWWRRRPSGQDGGPGTGWRLVGGKSTGFRACVLVLFCFMT
jgi:hypothetical protein